MKYYAIFEDDWPNSMKLTNHGHFQTWDEAADTFDKLFGNAKLGSQWKLLKLDDEDRMYHEVIYDLTKSEALARAAMAGPSRGFFARLIERFSKRRGRGERTQEAVNSAIETINEACVAYGRGDYATSLRLLRPLADQGP